MRVFYVVESLMHKSLIFVAAQEISEQRIGSVLIDIILDTGINASFNVIVTA
jgi:hypothetical protein